MPSRQLDGRVSTEQKISALTGLRGIAALWVVLYHLTNGGLVVINQGYLGVDVFFILSGYVLSYVYAAKFDPTDFSFYFRFLTVRLARIYPLHAVTLGILGLLVVALPQYAQRYPLADQRWGVDAFAASVLLVQNWGHFLPTCWNTPAWSLSAEWFAYLAFPAFLVATQWPRSSRTPLLLVCCLFFLYNGMLLIRGDPVDVHGTPGMVRMVTEFAAGCLLYCASARGLRSLPVMYDLAVVALLLLAFLFPKVNSFALLAFALIVLLAAQEKGATARFLSAKQVVYLGEISYSIYLIHWPLIQLSNWFVVAHGSKTFGSRLVLQAGVLGVVLVLSSLSYRWIELPARAWGRRLARQSTGRALASRAGAAAGNPESTALLLNPNGARGGASRDWAALRTITLFAGDTRRSGCRARGRALKSDHNPLRNSRTAVQNCPPRATELCRR